MAARDGGVHLLEEVLSLLALLIHQYLLYSYKSATLLPGSSSVYLLFSFLALLVQKYYLIAGELAALAWQVAPQVSEFVLLY
jgi:hypothetical protein